MLSKLLSALLISLACAALSYAQSPAVPDEAKALTKREVHLIYFGGPDCPPCVAWRQDELPKLEKTDWNQVSIERCTRRGSNRECLEVVK